MKSENKWFENLEQERQKISRREEIKKDCKTCGVMVSIGIVILLLALLKCTSSCESDNVEKQNDNSLYWKNRHDEIPDQFKGYWCSVTDKTTEVLNVTDEFIMTKDFTINRTQDNIVVIDETKMHLYQNGEFFALAFGVNGELIITAFNDCYDTVVPFEPTQPDPQEPVFN